MLVIREVYQVQLQQTWIAADIANLKIYVGGMGADTIDLDGSGSIEKTWFSGHLVC